jgi:hypothetical protein
MTDYRGYRHALVTVASLSGIFLIIGAVLALVWGPAQDFIQAIYPLLLWITLLPGLVASGVFLWLHRPKRWFDPAAINATGWVIVIGLLYLRSAITLLISSRNAIPWRGVPNALNSIGFGLAVDFLLIYRIVSFLQYRLTYRRRQAELDKERAELEQEWDDSRERQDQLDTARQARHDDAWDRNEGKRGIE